MRVNESRERLGTQRLAKHGRLPSVAARQPGSGACARARGCLGLVALARDRRVVRFLIGRLCVTAEDEKWRAVRALGVLAREPGLLTDARVHDLLQRFLWALNDESGAVPYGVPEAMGEILAARPEHRAAMLPILCGMLTEEETFQTGAVERGLPGAGPGRTRRAHGLPGSARRRRGGRAEPSGPGDPRHGRGDARRPGDYSSSCRTWSSNSLMKVRLRMSAMRSR